jgi:serine/threonine protein kinase
VASSLTFDAGSQDRIESEVEDTSNEAELAAIGKYRVLGLLARGGQSLVYRAVDLTLQRDLVIKMSRRPLQVGSPNRELLVNEGRLLCQLDHPGVVRVVDLDFFEDRPYLVMEYIRGKTLRQHLSGRRVPPAEAALLLAQVARAVGHAHALGIVHQDLKPDNILIDLTGRPRVIDFGLARLLRVCSEEPHSDLLCAGTPSYMAPEQAKGAIDRIGPPADVFALGAILYEMLVGTAPFKADDTQKSLQRAQACEFDRAALNNRRIPRRLAAVCLRAMAANPDERFASADEFAAALEAAVDSRRQWLLLAMLSIVLIVGIGWFLWQLLPPRPPPQEVQYLVHLHRDGGPPVWVNQAVPVMESWPFRIECNVPAGWPSSIFWFDPDGQVEEMPVASRVLLPGGLQEQLCSSDLEFDHKQGMELVMVCATPRKKPELAEVEPILREVLGVPPRIVLPPGTLVVMTSDRVSVQAAGESVRGPRKRSSTTELTELESRFDTLRQRLSSRYAFVAAVAFPHGRQGTTNVGGN